MANIRINRNQQENDENQFNVIKSVRSHSVKKQRLGELKNVINSQNSATPFRSDGSGMKKRLHPNSAEPSKYLRNDVLIKQQFKKNFENSQFKIDNITNDRNAVDKKPVTSNSRDIFDDSDFPLLCCTKKCEKGDAERWNQIPEIDDAKWNKLLIASDSIDVDEVDKDFWKIDCHDDNSDLVSVSDLLEGYINDWGLKDDCDDVDFPMTLPEFSDEDDLSHLKDLSIDEISF